MTTAIAQARGSQGPDGRESEPKANPPAEFDGTSRKKLETFIAENEIMFATAPRKYRSEESKVLVAGSYLKGDPKRWFNNFFLLPSDQRPDWFLSWNKFRAELRNSWGLEDPEGAAETELRRLKMTDKDHVSYFTSRFRAIQYRLPSWGDQNLRNTYHAALAPRIHAQFVSAGKIPPAHLEALIYMAEELDRTYWTDFELNRSIHHPSDHKPTSSTTSTSLDKKASEKSSSKKERKETSSSSATSTPASNSSSSKKPDPAYKKHLGPDGKLTPEERQRRIDNNLCLFCGQGKHVAVDCPKRKKPSAPTTSLARATITVESDSVKAESSKTQK